MQTTSLNLSKKINKFNTQINNYHCWCVGKFNNKEIIWLECQHNIKNMEKRPSVYPTYTLDEILEVLPRIIISENDPKIIYKFSLEFYEDEYFIGYGNANLLERSVCLAEFYHENLAEAAGQLLIWCIENGCIKIEENICEQ